MGMVLLSSPALAVEDETPANDRRYRYRYTWGSGGSKKGRREEGKKGRREEDFR